MHSCDGSDIDGVRCFLEGVDDQRGDDLVTAAKVFVTATGLKSTKELGSAAMSDLEGIEKWKDLDLRVRGFVRRAVTLVAEVARIKTAGPSQGAQSSDTQLTGLMTQLMACGAEISAQLVASGLASASATVPIEILKRNGLQTLPFGNRPDAAVFQLLEAASKAVSKGYPYLAFVYDEIVRRSRLQRVIAGEMVDLDKETSTIDRMSLDFARTRLSMVLKHAGLEAAATAVSAVAEVTQVAAESALAKQQAAAEALRRRAEQSAMDLARNQLQFEKGGKGDRSNKRKPSSRVDRDGWFGSSKYGKSGEGIGKSSEDGGGGRWY